MNSDQEFNEDNYTYVNSDTDTPSDLDCYDDYTEEYTPPSRLNVYRADRIPARPQINQNVRLPQSSEKNGQIQSKKQESENPVIKNKNKEVKKTTIQESKKPQVNNINTSFELGVPGEMKPLKHWILEECIESLQIAQDKIKSTGKPGDTWNSNSGVEAVWKKHKHFLEGQGYTQKNLNKSMERVIKLNKMKPQTGIGELDETDPEMRPTREEPNGDNDDITKQLVETVICMKCAYEADRKEAIDMKVSAMRSNSKYCLSDKDTKDDDSEPKQVPPGLDMKRRQAGEARSSAALNLDDAKEPKRPKTNNSSVGAKMGVAIDSISEFVNEKKKMDKERLEMEKQDREDRKREKEEEKEEKRRQREREDEERREKEERRERGREQEKQVQENNTKENQLDARIDAKLEEKFAEFREEANKREEGMKKFLTDLLKK